MNDAGLDAWSNMRMPEEIENGVPGVDWGLTKIIMREDNRLWVEFWIL